MIKKYFKILVYILIALWLVGAAGMALFSEKFIFSVVSKHTPESIGEQLFYERGFGSNELKGETVDARWLAHPTSSQVVLYLSGSAGREPEIMKSLAEHYNVLSPSYPSYEKSEGKPSTKTVYETATSSVHYLLAHGYQPHDIIVWGHSLGGSPAVYLATIFKNFKRVILVNTFDSIKNMGFRRYGPLAVFGGGIFDSISLAPQAGGVFRQFHVLNDNEIPEEAALKLFGALPMRDKVFALVEGTHSVLDVAATLRDCGQE